MKVLDMQRVFTDDDVARELCWRVPEWQLRGLIHLVLAMYSK